MVDWLGGSSNNTNNLWNVNNNGNVNNNNNNTNGVRPVASIHCGYNIKVL